MELESQNIKKQFGFLKSSLRIFAFLAVLFLFLFTLVFIISKTSFFQNYVKEKVVSLIRTETNQELSIGSFNFNIVNGTDLGEIFLKDHHSDTLFYCRVLNIGLQSSLLSLLQNSLYIQDVSVQDGMLKVIAYPDEERNSLNTFIKKFKKKKSSGTNSKFRFELQDLDLRNFRYKKLNIESSRTEDFFVQKMIASIRGLNLNTEVLCFENMDADGVSVTLTKDSIKLDMTSGLIHDAAEPKTEVEVCSNAFVIQVVKGSVKNSSFVYNNNIKPALGQSNDELPKLDYNHINLRDVNVSLNSFNMDGYDFYSQNLDLQCKDHSGFNINKFNIAECVVNDKTTKLNNFIFTTDHSSILDSLQLKYGSYSSFLDFNNKVFIDFKSKKCKVGIHDLIYFSPGLASKTFFKSNIDESFLLEGHIVGKVNSLKSNQVAVSLANKINFLGSFSSRNLAVYGEELINLTAVKLTSSMVYVEDIFPQLVLPENIKNLGAFSFNGKFDGYIGDFVSYGQFKTELGIINTDINLNLRAGKDKAKYSGNVSLFNFNLGKLAGLNELNDVNLSAKVRNGVGLTWESINADLSASVDQFYYKNKVYKNILFNGKFTRALLDGTLVMDDENIKFAFDGKISDINTVPKYNFKAKVSKLDLQSLEIARQIGSIKAEMDINMFGKGIENLRGDILLKNISLEDKTRDKILNLSKIYSKVSTFESGKRLLINSDFVELSIDGNFELAHIDRDIISILKVNIPSLPIAYTAPVSSSNNFNFTMDNFKVNSFIEYLDIPMEVKILNIHGSMQSPSNMEFVARIDSLRYSSAFLSGIYLESKWSQGIIKSKSIISKLDVGDKIHFSKLHINQDGNSVKSIVSIFSIDSLSKAKSVELIGLLKYDEKVFSFEIPSNQFTLNNDTWYMAQNNKLAYANKLLFFKNFAMTDSSKFFSIANFDNRGLKINADGFDVAIIHDFVKVGGVSFSGLSNLEVIVEDYLKVSNVRASLNVFQFYLNKSNYGPLGIKCFLKNAQTPLQVELDNHFRDYAITGVGTINIPFTKDYKLEKYNTEILINLLKAPLRYLEDFIPGISETRGHLEGPVFLNIKKKKLYLNGELTCDKMTTKLNYLGAKIKCNTSKIALQDDKIIFDKLTVMDELSNPISVNGYIQHKNFKSFFVNCDIRSERALILNTTKKDNFYYYGYGICKFNSTYTGDLNKINIYVNAASLRGSKLVIPINYDQSSESKDFVIFKKKEEQVSVIQKPIDIRGMNFKMDLSVQEESEVQIIFDESAGDIMKINGSGNLQISSLRDNTFSMTGDYVIDHGQYLFTLLNVVNKPFEIKRGGLLKWTGDPVAADINLVAKYDGLNAPIYTFIQEYLNEDSNLKEEAKRRSEIDLSMILSGSLLKPEILFKLGFPALTGQVKNFADVKLRELESNQDLLNQQIFGLLVFGTFLNSSNPFQSGIISNFKSTTINTLSEMLFSQFSLFATNLLSEVYGHNKFVSGIDVNVGYDSNQDPVFAQNGFNQGEFVFSLKHRLWNDQWAVTLGANYSTTPSLYGNSNFNPESVIEWNTPIRGMKLRLYYKSDDSINGVKHKLGSGVTYRREFDSFLDFKNALKDNLPKRNYQ